MLDERIKDKNRINLSLDKLNYERLLILSKNKGQKISEIIKEGIQELFMKYKNLE